MRRLVDEIEAGKVRALIVVGGNPLIAFPDRDRTQAALASLEALAVADVVETDTTALATHLLPVAGQLERADLPWMLDAYQPAVATQYTPAVVPPGADRRLMWQVFADLGRRLGLDVLPRGIDPDTATDEDLLALIAERGRSDATTVMAARRGLVGESRPIHGWVLDRVLPDGRWRVAPEPLVAQLADLDEPAPVMLLPRRQDADHERTATRLGRRGPRGVDPLRPRHRRRPAGKGAKRPRRVGGHRPN